jgi:citrate lyase subunit beta / citryl-CoA lyase
MRSWIFVPGHSAKMIEKSFGLDVDVVMLDLEDGVVPKLKDEARKLVAAALTRPSEGERPQRYVRVNGFGTSQLAPDLEAIVHPQLHGIVVPKVETVEQVGELDTTLTRLERGRDVEEGRVKLMLAVESAKALLAASAMASASARVSGLMFGAEDFSRDLGLPTVRTGVAREFTYARSVIVVAAAAARVISVDGVWPDLKDSTGLEEDCVLARALGFTGKSMIHPSQAEPINRIFRPTPDEVDYAQRLICEFEQALAAGHGSISFGGMLVDRPIYERARATVRIGSAATASTVR